MLVSVASTGLAVALLVIVLPGMSGVDLPTVGAELAEVEPVVLAGLTVLAMAVLWCGNYVITGSLPGMTQSHAFQLAAVGTAVSNVVPLGGVVGTTTAFLMGTSWGHSVPAIGVSVTLTGVWNLVGRLVFPSLVLLAAAGFGFHTGNQVLWYGLAAAAALVAGGVVLTRRRTIDLVTRLLTRLLGDRLGSAFPGVTDLAFTVVKRNWRQMTIATCVVSVLHGALLWACLAAAGTWVEPGSAVVLFAVSRMLTLVVITPGATGVTEGGTLALLLSWGHAGPEAAAGVLLFTLFTTCLESLVGGLCWMWWTLRRDRTARQAAAGG
ncbi:lysylphosphatidylglycerol synthase domain-containing protein [Nocardia sp. NRRL S-836]|uniref:lysylphosphatidylglycerol synthase domain-containing protein n=1 Tax=Nocardia sp. NRRL S-836 TaxID=1519492 RepID=UPI0012FB3961|nr:lysylphosphatidylglycerol synthase domain-containing protein [Nocardia sp. NRRL S-836]